MTQQFQVGSTLKLNPDMFTGEVKDSNHYGVLGYPGIMRDWIFELTNTFTHSKHGEMGEFKCLTLQLENNVFLRLEECILASNKLSIDFQIINPEIKSKTMEEIALLNVELEKVIASKKYKTNGIKERSIRKKIEELKSLELKEEVQLFVPNIRKTINVTKKQFEDKTLLNNILRNAIREFRLSSKKIFPLQRNVHGIDFTMLKGVHTEPYTYGKITETLLKDYIKKPKVPVLKDKNYLGIEIECLVRCSKEELEHLFVKNRLHKHVQVGTDGSIVKCNDNYVALEIRILVTEDELQSVMMKVHRVLKSKSVSAYVNKSCGVHVHLDMRNRNVEKSYTKLFNVQSLLRDSQPLNRHESTYCKPNTEYSFKNSKERYSVINTESFKKHKTLEIRVHEGTVNGINIINWCKFLTGVLSEQTVINSPVKSMDELMKLELNIPKEGLDYISNRLEEFNSSEVA
jgi:hypothetical protein